MSRDPLGVLLRLRRLDVNTAQRDLALRLRAAAEAEAAQRAAQAAIAHEAVIAAGRAAEPVFAALFSQWLPHGQGAAEASRVVRQSTERQAEAARTTLAAAHVAAQAIESLRAERIRAARLTVLRAEQAALDEYASRGAPPRPAPSAQ
jgi:hypothetical protein